MEGYRKRKPEGQVLVIVALSLVALVAVVALAVDVGNIYAERRKMQNAADAGALAGAYEICHGDDSESAIIAKAQQYTVDQNGAMGADIKVHVLDSGDPISVTVVATETAKTFFAGLIGWREVDISAEAAAVCGKAKSSGLVWPIGYSEPKWPGYVSCDNDPGDPPEYVILWVDGESECGPGEFNCCNLYKKKNDAVPEIFLPNCSNGQPDNPPLDARTWIDFSAGIILDDPCDQPGCGDSELRDRIVGQDNKGNACQSWLEIPTCIAGDMGVKTDSWKAAEEAIDKIVVIPLFDPAQSGANGDPGVCTLKTEAGTSCTNLRFKIISLGCIQIDGPYYLRDFDKGTPGPRIILVHIPCLDGKPHPDCARLLGSSDGTIPEPGDIRAVSLIQ